jgi:hypothetical protein
MFIRLLLLISLIQSSWSFSQIGMGEWRLHIPALDASDVASVGKTVYASYFNGVSEYDPESGEISTWDAISGLSDIAISCIGSDGDRLYIAYENGNFDILENNRVTNIPAIQLAQIQGSKQINRIVPYEGHVFLATGFGIVRIDPDKEEVRETYYPTQGLSGIIDIAFRNDSIFALTSDELYVGNLNNPALVDPTQWIVDPRVPQLSVNSYTEIERVQEQIFINLSVDGFGNDTVYVLSSTEMSVPFIETFPMEVQELRSVNNNLLVCYFDGFVQYDSDFNQIATLYTYGSSLPRPNAAIYNSGSYYVADKLSGLVKLTGSSAEALRISGPPLNSYYSLDWENGKLAVAGGGLSGVNKTFNSAGVYAFEDESWTWYSGQNVNKWNGTNFSDALAVSVDGTNEDHIAVGSISEIPLTILMGNVADTFTPYNSPLEFTGVGSAISMVSDVCYDSNGNLWVLNSWGAEPLKVYTTDGAWHSFSIGSGGVNQFSRKLIVDYDGNKWFTFRNQGLYGYNDNGTISNPSDDKYINLNVGEQTGALPSSEVTAIAVDFDNEIWIGTDNGFAVLYNSDGAFDAGLGGYNAQRIKLEFEGNVEYVLGSTHITDIEVDGGNRKWMATENSGLVLLSPDGQEVLQQFTTENSPLISNSIIDVEIDHKSGEVFIITDKGLVSYRSDASYEDPDYTTVTVFPNPARPDFEGPITIQGIRYDSDVKITDVAGNLVYQTTSNGGTATWNGRTLSGEKVATGVYLIWTAANEGKGRYVGKVLVVN